MVLLSISFNVQWISIRHWSWSFLTKNVENLQNLQNLHHSLIDLKFSITSLGHVGSDRPLEVLERPRRGTDYQKRSLWGQPLRANLNHMKQESVMVLPCSNRGMWPPFLIVSAIWQCRNETVGLLLENHIQPREKPLDRMWPCLTTWYPHWYPITS